VLNVKKFLLLATCVATLLTWQCSLGLAQAPLPAVPPPTIAIIDLNRIFKDLIRFKAMRDAMTADVQQAEAQAKRDQEELQALAKQLQDMKPGHQDYKRLDEDVTTRNAQLTARIRSQSKDFQQREAQIMYTIYQEITDEIKLFATHNGITLVLRFNGEAPDVNVPQDILREVNKPVVYYNAQIDITQYVLNSLNARAGAVNPTARVPSSVPAPRR
jgi:Skp family chaperone for outer membrane proteins